MAWVDADAAILATAAKRLDLPAEGCSPSLEQALAAFEAEAVLITTPVGAHIPVALEAIAVYQPLWRGRCASCEAPAALGGTPVQSHAELMVEAVRLRIAEPLDRFGIAIDRTKLEELLAA